MRNNLNKATPLNLHLAEKSIIMSTEEEIEKLDMPVANKGICQKAEQPCKMTDEQRWQMEQHLQNEQWESNISNLYTYGEDGFCDGFTNW